jgi:hypothetical protein
MEALLGSGDKPLSPVRLRDGCARESDLDEGRGSHRSY